MKSLYHKDSRKRHKGPGILKVGGFGLFCLFLLWFNNWKNRITEKEIFSVLFFWLALIVSNVEELRIIIFNLFFRYFKTIVRTTEKLIKKRSATPSLCGSIQKRLLRPFGIFRVSANLEITVKWLLMTSYNQGWNEVAYLVSTVCLFSYPKKQRLTILIKYLFVKQLGEKGTGIKGRTTVQDFVQLRDSCLENGTLFEDPSFPAEDSSIYYSRRSARNFEWLRPTVI